MSPRLIRSPEFAHETGAGRRAARKGRRGGSRRRETQGAERGSSTIQHVFILPALFTLMFVFVQGAMYYQGRAIAIAAAEEGARVAAAEDGTVAAGIAASRRYVEDTTSALSGTSATGFETPNRVSITVTTHTVSLVPGWKPTVAQTANLPIERLTTG